MKQVSLATRQRVSPLTCSSLWLCATSGYKYLESAEGFLGRSLLLDEADGFLEGRP
jgi:hypothetical protein